MKPKDRLRIRLESGVAAETLANYLADPTSVKSISAERIERAARKLRIALSRASSPSERPAA